MKHTLLRLSALLIVVMLALTGCNLIAIDPIMQLDEDLAKAKKNYSGVLATYDGGQITQEDIMGAFAMEYNYMSQLYAMYGLSLPTDAMTSMAQEAVENAIEDVAIDRELTARGISLDEEKLTAAQTSAAETFQQAYDSFYSGADGKTDEVRAKQTEYNMYVSGYTAKAFEDIEVNQAKRELLEETIEAEIETVTDEELQAAFDEKVADDEAAYADSPASFESAMTSSSTDVYWMPEGYRTVKHILVIPEDDVLSAVTSARSAYDAAVENIDALQAELDALNAEPAEDAEAEEAAEETEEAPRTAEQIQAEIDEATAGLEALRLAVETAEADCLTSVQDKVDEIYEKLEAGEDFDALIEAYGEDPGMQNEPTSTRGYYVSANSENWDPNFTAGAMALENVGDYSQTPVIGTSGLHIIRYESDVTPGAVDFETVRDALYEETLSEMKEAHYEETLEALVNALNPKYTMSAFHID